MNSHNAYLRIVSQCDSFPYPSNPAYANVISSLWSFIHLTSTETFVLGYITTAVINALQHLPPHLSHHVSISAQSRTVSLTAPTTDSRSEALASILFHWREHKTFTILAGWRDECYPIYSPPGSVYAAIERAAAPLFGVVAHCVYLIGYSLGGDKRELKLWIPRRSKTKQTYAGMLDVTVAGAMVVGDEDAWNCVSREAFEEASLSVELVGAQAKEVARVSYFGVSTGNPEHGGGEAGLCLPEFGVVFEMKLDEGVVLKPRDGEVEKFYCWGVQEVKEALERGEFKGNSGAVMMDWLQRSGMLGQEKDIGAQVIRRMRRVLEFPHM